MTQLHSCQKTETTFHPNCLLKRVNDYLPTICRRRILVPAKNPISLCLGGAVRKVFSNLRTSMGLFRKVQIGKRAWGKVGISLRGILFWNKAIENTIYPKITTRNSLYFTRHQKLIWSITKHPINLKISERWKCTRGKLIWRIKFQCKSCLRLLSNRLT